MKTQHNLNKTLAWLLDNDFVPIDPVEFEEDEFDNDYLHITLLSAPDHLISETNRLKTLLQAKNIPIDVITFDLSSPYIQASYDPSSQAAIISLFGVDDSYFEERVMN